MIDDAPLIAAMLRWRFTDINRLTTALCHSM
jgi:hypothetical protein